MKVISVVDQGLGNSAYVVDLGDGQGMVIDPERNPSPYLDIADRLGLHLRWVVETHLHADFVSGGREVAALGARLVAPEQARLAFEHFGVADGDELDLGGLTLSVIATPGHTPEHCAYLLGDGSAPLAVFTGGTLIVGGIARTDLISPDLTEDLARAAYRSIWDRLMTLPDSLPVYPTHGGGSFCAASPSGERTTTIGHERLSNPLLQAVDENDFVARATGGLGSYPRYFLRLRDVNQAGAPVYGPSPPPLRPRTPEQVERLVKGGAEIVDLRPIAQYAAGHVPGSLSIELRPQFGSWLGWLVDPGREVIFIADPDQDLTDAVIQSLNVGYERLGGYVADGITGWQHSGRSVAQTRLLDADEVSPELTIVDVRQASEWNVDHVPGAAHVELGAIADHGVGLAGDLVLHCGHGQRSMTAASLLERAGHTNVGVTSASARELTLAIVPPGR